MSQYFLDDRSSLGLGHVSGHFDYPILYRDPSEKVGFHRCFIAFSQPSQTLAQARMAGSVTKAVSLVRITDELMVEEEGHLVHCQMMML